MGTFAGYNGKFKIPEEKRQEFVEAVLKVLNFGGMMQCEIVNLYGKKIYLLKPVVLDEEKELHFHYNYFEDDSWESAGFDAKECNFWSNKIGSFEFADVIGTVYALEELYDSEVGCAEINGEPIYLPVYIAWINHLMGTAFTIKTRYQLWKQYEKDCLDRLRNGYEYREVAEQGFIRNLVSRGYQEVMGGVELADILYIEHGTKDLESESLVQGSYPENIVNCKREIKFYFEENMQQKDEKISLLKELVQSNRETRSEIKGQLKGIAGYSLKIPARAIVYLMAEICEIEFWSIWEQLYETCYEDEDTSDYSSEELKKWRQNEINRPIEGMRTAEFLRQTSSFVFWDTPKELEDKPNYYLTDDDRLYWWDGSDEVVISSRVEKWLGELEKRHKKIIEELKIENYDKEDFLQEMIESLTVANDYYVEIYAFQNMFYEFLQNGSDKRYIAAIRLFKELHEENKDLGMVVQGVRSWEMASKNVKCNEGRMNIKRYLAVMANPKLRKYYLGF